MRLKVPRLALNGKVDGHIPNRWPHSAGAWKEYPLAVTGMFNFRT
jgi:hypothetical protein